MLEIAPETLKAVEQTSIERLNHGYYFFKILIENLKLAGCKIVPLESPHGHSFAVKQLKIMADSVPKYLVKAFGSVARELYPSLSLRQVLITKEKETERFDSALIPPLALFAECKYPLQAGEKLPSAI